MISYCTMYCILEVAKGYNIHIKTKADLPEVLGTALFLSFAQGCQSVLAAGIGAGATQETVCDAVTSAGGV